MSRFQHEVQTALGYLLTRWYSLLRASVSLSLLWKLVSATE